MARVVARFIFLVVTGLVGAALVAPPAGAAPTWRPVTNLFADLSAAGGSAQTPAVGVDAAGNATVVWSRYNGSQLVVQSSSRPVGGTWSAPVDLAAGRSIRNPQLAVDPAGNATAVWRRVDTDRSVVQAASRSADGAWTAPVDLSVDPSVDFSEITELPQVAVDAAGVATATWSRLEGRAYVVQVSTRSADAAWSTPVDISAPGQSARTPQVAVDPVGNTTVVWNLGANRITGGRLQATTRPAGGTWATPVDVSAAGAPATNPQLAVAATGEATVIWNSFAGASYSIQTATRPLEGPWTTPVALSAPGEENFVTPEIAAGPDGSTTALWQRHDGSGWIVTSATRPSGGTWGAAVDLSPTDHDGWTPQLAVDPDGDVTAIWSLAQGGDSGSTGLIQAARRSATGSWTAPVDLSVPGRNAFNPQVVVDADGNATTAWSRHDGTSWIVQARGLDAAGPVVTEITGATSTTSGRVRAYSVKAHDVWSRVASARWTFPDGTTATGMSVSHQGTRGGSGPVRVVLTDSVGNATACTYTGTFTCRSTTRVAPLVTRATLDRRTIRAIGADGPAGKKARATITLSTAAKVTLTFRKAGTRTTVRVVERLEAGRDVIAIRARLGKGKLLTPGRWRVVVSAENRFGTSPKERLRLRVVR